MTAPGGKISDALEFLAAQALADTGNVELAYSKEFSLAMARAYESGSPDKIAAANAIERKLKDRYKGEFNIRHFHQLVKIYRPQAASEKPRAVRQPGRLPEIIASNRQLRDVSSDAVQAVRAANDPPFVFVRSGHIVRVVTDECGRPSVEEAIHDWIRGILSTTADWMRFNQAGELKGTFPPKEVVANIACMSNPPFPALSNVTEVPSLRTDGTILSEAGYDAQSLVYYLPAPTLKSFPLPSSPTPVNVRAARDLIDEAIGEFPYADQASRANVFGLLLTPILRPAISGSTPLVVIDAPQAGTGKSLLIDVVSVITTGRPASMVPYPYAEEEMQKQIGSSLISGRQLIVFDNLEGDLKSPSLASVLTAKEYDARMLGFSRNMMIPNRSTWVVTGNNVKPAGDMPRRCYQIRLDARDSKPYTGREFKHPELLSWVTENRSELLHALLVIARYWFANGCPAADKQASAGSFEEWQRKISGIVSYAGIRGFLSNYVDFIEMEDESPRQWESFLSHLIEEWPDFEDPNGSRPFSAKQLLDKILPLDAPARDEAPAEILGCLEPRKNNLISIGKAMRKNRDRRFGPYWLSREESAGGHKGSALWRVKRS